VIEGEQIRRVESARFLGVWIEAGLNWRGLIGQVGTKVRQLLGVLGRVRADLDRHLLLSLYNSMVLPHFQYCLMMWGDFEAGRNKALLKLQKRFVGLIAEKGELFFGYGVLKVGDLYRQQLRLRLSGGWMSRMVTVPGLLGAGWW
jgi:hypothetical protein